MNKNTPNPRFAFFGTPSLAVTALNTLKAADFIPSLVVTNQDQPIGRKKTITPPPVKTWAIKNNIEVIQPTTLKDIEQIAPLLQHTYDFFVVFAYGKIIPESLLTAPQYGTINAHPSLLPKLRGASPIRSTLLHDLTAAGVTIIQMDKKLDHGDILLQTPFTLPYPIPGTDLDEKLATLCGELLAATMEGIRDNTIISTPQNHSEATYCPKITKDMAEITIDPKKIYIGEEALALYKKICAFDGWPVAFFIHNQKRIKITHAEYDPITTQLLIKKVIPEGKSEITFSEFIANYT